MMLRKLLATAVIAVIAAGVGFWLLTEPATVPANALGPHTPNLANGKTMFAAGGCASCHAVPKQDDRTRLGGGLALKTPFGTFYVPNISSDPTDGIGGWTEAQFVTALTKGTSPGGEHLYPAFPYTSYQNMTPDDVRDLFAYLKTLPPVAGHVRGHDLSFPFSIRRGVGLWKLLYLDGRPFKPDPSRSAVWNRGSYLVNGPAHCAECHSPRNFLGGIIERQRFAGGPDPTGRGWVPNITQRDLHAWSVQDIATLLETGQTPEGDSVGGEMVDVVRSLAELAPDERMAMAVYIKSLPPVVGPPPTAKK